MKSESLNISLPEDLVAALRSKLGSDVNLASATATIVGSYLRGDDARQRFVMMRFQILSLSLQGNMRRHLNDAYLYAWDVGIYPILHEAAQWHVPFSEQFLVSKQAMEHLMEVLATVVGEHVSFDDLERMMRDVDGLRDRTTLFDACRYAFLSRRYAASVWKVLLGSSGSSGFGSRMTADDEGIQVNLMNPPSLFGSA